MSSYINPKINFPGLNWKNLPEKIRYYKVAGNEKQVADLVEDCFNNKYALPTQTQLMAVAAELQNSPSLMGVFQSELRTRSNKILGLPNVFSQFQESRQWQEVTEHLATLFTSGDEEVNKLIKILKNPVMLADIKTAEMTKVLQNHIASTGQLHEILTSVKGTQLSVVFWDTLNNLPQKINSTTIKDFLADDRVKSTLMNAFSDKKNKGAASLAMQQIIDKTGPWGDYFQDAEFKRFYDNGMRYRRASQVDGIQKIPGRIAQNLYSYWKDASHLAPRSVTDLLKSWFIPR